MSLVCLQYQAGNDSQAGIKCVDMKSHPGCNSIQSHLFSKAGTCFYFFLEASEKNALCMITLDMMSQLVSSCSSWCYYQRISGDAGVCEPRKTNKDKSLRLIIKSGIMIALCEDASQMYY